MHVEIDHAEVFARTGVPMLVHPHGEVGYLAGSATCRLSEETLPLLLTEVSAGGWPSTASSTRDQLCIVGYLRQRASPGSGRRERPLGPGRRSSAQRP